MMTRKTYCITILALCLGLQGSLEAGGFLTTPREKALRLIASGDEAPQTMHRRKADFHLPAASQSEQQSAEDATPGNIDDFFLRMGCTTCADRAPVSEQKESQPSAALEKKPEPAPKPVARAEEKPAPQGVSQFADHIFAIMGTDATVPATDAMQDIEVIPATIDATIGAAPAGSEIDPNGLRAETSSDTGFALEAGREATDVLLAQQEPESLLQDEFEEYQLLLQDLSREVADEKYRLQIGDQLVISIYGEDGTAREVSVDALGNVNYLLVGSVPAFGKTIDELRQELNARVRKVFKHALVTITPSQFGGQYYTILGEVMRPGRKLLLGHLTLLSALADGGGMRTGGFRSQTVELADLSHAFLARDGDYVPVDFARLVFEGDTSQDIPFRPGEYIYIPSTLYKEIHILGEVNQPTTIGYTNVVTLAEAICQARGLREDVASSRVIVIRGSLVDPIRIEADIKRILKGFEQDIVLQPGDIVYVPPRRFQTAREWVKAGIRAFVGAAAAAAGSRTFIHIHPHAGGGGSDLTPVTVIPTAPVFPVGN
jgi:protein involved in polysaccharide export with SLBB domain